MAKREYLLAGPDVSNKLSNSKIVFRRILRHRGAYLLLMPGLIYFIIYKFAPMLGLIVAFQDFNPMKGFLGSKFIGFAHFYKIFADEEVVRVLVNTLQISFLQIVFAFPMALVFALMLNEVRSQAYKRIIQSIVYLPHFLSWVVVVGIFYILLKSDGLITNLLVSFGFEKTSFLTSPALFKPLVIFQVIWKESGWGTIIFLAALAGVNPQLYEAAVMDGAGRWNQIWHITLPAIRSTIVILLILRLGSVLDVGFEQIFLMLNSFVKDVGDVLDTYVYEKGIRQADVSFATAVGLFKGIVGMILVVAANWFSKRFGEQGLF
jgi:putative aldouronate transport system permease protein